MCLWAMLEAKVARLVLGGRLANIPGLDYGPYSVESFMAFSGRRIELVTGLLQGECEALRIEWARRKDEG